MKKYTWILALALPIAVISCKKSAVHEDVQADEPSSLLKSPGVASQTGNGAPSGAHYSLNIIGVPKGKTADMTGNNGHRIFVNLDSKGSGATKILLNEGADFQVTDANGTYSGGNEAAFKLPNPVASINADGTVTTKYSVFARIPGQQKGSATLTTCADYAVTEDVNGDEALVPIELELCAGITFNAKDPSRFVNVSAELLFVTLTADIMWDNDGDATTNDVVALKAGRYPLFDERLQGFFWNYDNYGLKLLQLRFYDVTSIVDVTPDENGGYDPTK